PLHLSNAMIYLMVVHFVSLFAVYCYTFVVCFTVCGDSRDLHSFPTRRSSDLTRTRERGWSWRTRLRRYDGGMPGDSPRPVPPWPSGWTGWSRCDGPSPRDAMRWTTAGTAGPPKPFSRQPRGRGPTRTG